MAFGEHPMMDPMMNPEAALASLPKPRRKIWREELLVDEAFLAYKDRTEVLPDPELIERIFLLIRRRDRHLVVRLGDRRQPWEPADPRIRDRAAPGDGARGRRSGGAPRAAG